MFANRHSSLPFSTNHRCLNVAALIALACTVLGGVGTTSLQAQGSAQDYERMARLRQKSNGLVFRTNVEPRWHENGQSFWYRLETSPKKFEFILADLKSGTREPAFSHEALATQLGKATDQELDSKNLKLGRLSFSDDLATVQFQFSEKRWSWDRNTDALTESESAVPEASSPKWLDTIRPSVDKGGEMQLRVSNKSQEALKMVWIDREGGRVPYETVESGSTVEQHTFTGHIWLILNSKSEPVALFEANPARALVEVDGEQVLELRRGNRRQRRRRGSGDRAARGNAVSPDGRFRIEIRDDELWLTRTDSDAEVQLGGASNPQAEFSSNRIFWAPDSESLVIIESTPGENRQVLMVESSPEDQLQPELHQMTYVKPGDKIRTDRPRLFNLNLASEVNLDLDLIKNPWSLSDFRWREDSSEFCFYYNQRGHGTVAIVGINAADGQLRYIVDESTDSFVDYTNKVFSSYSESSDEIIWMSERSGWCHLYLYDWNSGEVTNPITQGDWVVREVERVDWERRQIWFQASGIDQEQDPYYIHHCRVDFNGENLVRLTCGDGTHRIEYSPTGEYIVDRYSRVDQPTITEIRRVDDGSLVCELEVGDDSRLRETGWQATRRFVAKGRDGKTEIHGVIWLPTNFDESKTYPVIEYIYAGPHNSFVPKRYSTYSQTRAMAELGFIVVQIDGMGTSNRSKAFHDVCWKNLGDSGFPDRILWLKAAAQELPQMDIGRVGIYGGSAGGQSALRALLAYGDFYKVAVSDCGCHDNRMDKIWWNEQWMGWPIGPHYEEQSNVTQAKNLEGKLFLIVGELDRNVDPASTMQVVNALIKANKDFDLLVVPGAGHGIGSGRYGMRRTRDFFVRHLLDREPRWNDEATGAAEKP